jgi:hypothetical protein
MSDIIKATPEDAGCCVDGHWGIYSVARMVERAQEWGYSDAEVIDLASRHLASMEPSTNEGLTDNEHEHLIDASDDVEEWLNANIAPEGHSFGWYEGEFFLESDQWWNEAY